MEAVNLAEKFSRFSEVWSPKIVGEINDFYVKLVKLRGEFLWHHHEREDELFLVLAGRMRMKFRENGIEREIPVGPGEFCIVPRGMEHKPSADEASVLLIEPKTTLNTGNIQNERTVGSLEAI